MREVQDIINYIMWDRRFVSVPSELHSPFDIIIIHNPTVEDRNIAFFEKEQVYARALIDEVPTEASILKDAIESDFWTKEDDKIFTETEKYIAWLEAERPKKKLMTQKARIDAEIKEAKEKLKGVSEKRQELLSNTAEYLSQETFAFSLVFRTVKTTTDQPFFVDQESVFNMRQQNMAFLNFLIKEVISEGVLPHAELRRVARSMEWRLLWTLNKENLASLFSIKLANLSANQRLLTYWSRVYDIAFESTEKPDDDIINDDAKFDEWLNNRDPGTSNKTKPFTSTDNSQELGVVLDGYYVEECTCGVASIKVMGHGERPPHGPECEWGVYKRYTSQEKEERARQIYGKNSNRVRSLINSEHDAVASVGVIDEKDLRKTKSRNILGAKQNVQNIRI